MAEYINRELLLKDLETSIVVSGKPNVVPSELRGVHKVIDRIKSAPTEDAVPVVRCKDCKHCDHFYPRCDKDGTLEERYSCMVFDYIVQPNGFCSYGERK